MVVAKLEAELHLKLARVTLMMLEVITEQLQHLYELSAMTEMKRLGYELFASAEMKALQFPWIATVVLGSQVRVSFFLELNWWIFQQMAWIEKMLGMRTLDFL